MSKMELLDSPTSEVNASEEENGYEVHSPSYSMLFHTDSPYIDLFDSKGTLWMQAFKGSTVATSEYPDTTYAFEDISYARSNTGDLIVRVPSINDVGVRKEQVWICRDTFIETFVVAEATGSLQHIDLLGGTYVAPNMFGQSLSQRHFESVYNPQPSEMERSAISALESTRITTSGMWQPGRRREFLISPMSYGFNISPPGTDGSFPPEDWLMASISAPIEHQHMVDYRYDVHEDGFALTLDYDGTRQEAGTFVSPSLLLHFAPHPLEGLQDLTRYAKQLGHLDEISAPLTTPWHNGTTYVTWGNQLEHEQRLHQQGIDIRARDILTEPFVRNALDFFDAHDIPIDTVVLDDKWQSEYGTNTPDLRKWPDLARFNRAQHEVGRHILLWVKLFDPEGLPPELCILDALGRPIASDPTNPTYLEYLGDQVRVMLDPGCLDADGLKLDFLAQLPHGPGLRWHGNERGHAALHKLLKTVYTQALTTKKDAMIEAQVVNPWFADVMNRIRLNDTNERHSVTTTMGSRARLSSSLLPNYPIDPDGWPMPNVESWLEYIKVQPNLTGTVTTHFVDTVRGNMLTPDQLELVRTATIRARSLRQEP